jgi:hypothetical protein
MNDELEAPAEAVDDEPLRGQGVEAKSKAVEAVKLPT